MTGLQGKEPEVTEDAASRLFFESYRARHASLELPILLVQSHSFISCHGLRLLSAIYAYDNVICHPVSRALTCFQQLTTANIMDQWISGVPLDSFQRHSIVSQCEILRYHGSVDCGMSQTGRIGGSPTTNCAYLYGLIQKHIIKFDVS
ncbi:uncharacterized protein ARMOST_14208 [Armillaria ostoyae]|uniref:Uncharacterized protein n=1 Tax=Armillaria ostoyae TaxID=47428 RepID=A0A284RPY5_ARMOS|nr:uncharacterized protein ARMOST_14208 [Armillaria ostoyae]